jgi:hypothetical protein
LPPSKLDEDGGGGPEGAAQCLGRFGDDGGCETVEEGLGREPSFSCPEDLAREDERALAREEPTSKSWSAASSLPEVLPPVAPDDAEGRGRARFSESDLQGGSKAVTGHDG